MSKVIPPLRIRVKAGTGEESDIDLSFSGPFRIGRDPSCEVILCSRLVSRFHAEVWPGSGSWWVRDLGSTNRLLLNGATIDRGELKDGSTLQLGKGAPTLLVSIPSETEIEDLPLQERDVPTTRALDKDQSGQGVPTTIRDSKTGSEYVPREGRPPVEDGGSGLSLSQIEEKYLNPESNQPAGERTQFIRLAYARVRKREKRKATLALAGVGFMLLVSAGYGLIQRQRVRRIDRQAAELFRSMKQYDVQLFSLRQRVEESGSQELMAELAALESVRQDAMSSYEVFVRERGLYRRLKTREDTLIYETARLFGESEFEISSSFIEAVLQEVRGYWLSPSGRTRFRQAVERAAENGYAEGIVSALRRRGIPPEFYYLALQESDFHTQAVGPETRWGRAKGMWQFIPATAQRYGLRVGSMADTPSRDPADERLDFQLATDAAARYLRDLHGQLTQASGLLVMAAYNWGEHRVLPRLEDLPEPRDVFQEQFAGVPTNPASRNYWTFLTEYEESIPEETKQYVIRIFSAAVIGRDPQYFGMGFRNPIAPYLDRR